MTATLAEESVQLLSGFDRATEHNLAALAPSVEDGLTNGLFDSVPDCPLLAYSPCSIVKNSDDPYLLCILRHRDVSGWMEIYRAGELVDTAELIEGWQTAAVNLSSVPAGSHLEIRFLDSTGGAVEAIEVSRLWLSDSWGRGRRRYLKCYAPFETINVFTDRAVHPCCARQWLKPGTCAGNADDSSLPELWNGKVYQSMRQNFLDGNYEANCRSDVCPWLNLPAADMVKLTGRRLRDETIAAINEGSTHLSHGPTDMYHDIDLGCNLACTMCRDDKILPDRKKVSVSKADIETMIDMGNLERLWMSGAGEIFIMRDIIALLESDQLSSNEVSIIVTTNATNFNEAMWKRVSHNRFEHVCISADGCSPEIYESVRLGSKWQIVERNMRFAAKLRQQGDIGILSWNYTVQKATIPDVAKAILFARELGFDCLRFIAQMGSQSGTDGNMFEDFDIDSLDELYAQIDSVGGFDDGAKVSTLELRIAGRRHHKPSVQLEMAEYIFDRMGPNAAERMRSGDPEWTKCAILVERALATANANDSDSEAISERNRDFLERFHALSSDIPQPGPRWKAAARASIGWLKRKLTAADNDQVESWYNNSRR